MLFAYTSVTAIIGLLWLALLFALIADYNQTRRGQRKEDCRTRVKWHFLAGFAVPMWPMGIVAILPYGIWKFSRTFLFPNATLPIIWYKKSVDA